MIVVAQGEEPPLRRAVAAAAADDPRVRFLHIDRTGLSIARNEGIAASNGEVVALMDDDCEAEADWLEVLDEYFVDPAIGLVGGSLVAPAPERRLGTCPEMIASELVYDPIESDRTEPPGWGLVGGNFAIRRSVHDQLGGFDDHLGAGTRFGAAEETDLLLRLERLGTTMATTPRSVVRHTYGFRYGIAAIYGHKRNYARGNGALGAKLTLLGDDRGEAWMRDITAEVRRRLAPRRLPSLPLAAFRLWHYRRARTICLRDHEVAPHDDPVRAVLRRRSP